ncbi:MAG: hypothetical protein ACK2U6_05065 [Candidatus Promineifilaceae bacterium]
MLFTNYSAPPDHALKRDVFALLHEAAKYNVAIQFLNARLATA